MPTASVSPRSQRDMGVIWDRNAYDVGGMQGTDVPRGPVNRMVPVILGHGGDYVIARPYSEHVLSRRSLSAWGRPLRKTMLHR